MDDDLTPEELQTWNAIKYDISGYEMVTMTRHREVQGDVEIFLYVHVENKALHYTKVMVDGIEVAEQDFVAQYEPDTRYHHVEMFRPFHFMATFKW